MYVVKHWFMKCLTFVYQVYCVYFSVKHNVMTTCPTAPIFLAELRLGPAGLWPEGTVVTELSPFPKIIIAI